MRNKLISILLNPLFLSVIIASLIIIFLPEYFSKYKVELKKQFRTSSNSRVYFHDLDGDFISERIRYHHNSIGNASLMIYNSKDELIDQWNFYNKIASTSKQLSFSDIDNNGYKEISLLTISQDSVFLNIVEPLHRIGIDKKNIYVDSAIAHNEKFTIYSGEIKSKDIDSDDIKELFFNISGGFSGYPRHIYKYTFKDDKITQSPHLTNHSVISEIVDLDTNGTCEIIIRNYSASNIIDTSFTKRSDYSTWLTVLNSDFTFRFNPIEFSSKFSSLNTLPIKRKNKNVILCLFSSKQYEKDSTKLTIFSDKGKLITDKIVSHGHYMLHKLLDKKEIILFNRTNGILNSLDYNLNNLYQLQLSNNSEIWPIDFNTDKNNEWLLLNSNQLDATIYSHDFKNKTTFEIPKKNNEKLLHGLMPLNINKNQLYFQRGQNIFIYRYIKNDLYYFKYLIYSSIFLASLLLVSLIMKLQEIRSKKKQAIEKQIAELQLKTVKNQVDPHFVFNAINTISEMTLTDNKLEADDFISKFSGFMRSTLTKSDTIVHSLEQEINYTEQYIQLQQIRFLNQFKCSIVIDHSIDKSLLIPKHIIYSYVENAMKYGISNANEKGVLQIAIREGQKCYIIKIQDNGKGFKNTLNKGMSTGNGIKIMEKIYTLYYQLYKRKITQKIDKIKNEKGEISGMLVEVHIYK